MNRDLNLYMEKFKDKMNTYTICINNIPNNILLIEDTYYNENRIKDVSPIRQSLTFQKSQPRSLMKINS